VMRILDPLHPRASGSASLLAWSAA
jgi:hypothetical protein